MWIKFSLLLIISIYSLVLGLYISRRNIAKELSIKYFGLMCFSAFVWIFCMSISQISKNPQLTIILAKLFYIAATLIFIFFTYFAIHFLYTIKNYRAIRTLINTSVSIISILIFFFLIIGYKTEGSMIIEIENKTIHLIYGIYIISILIISYYILFKKFITSSGINKSRIKHLIIFTLFPFLFGVFFDWYIPFINKHYLDWIGPVFAIIMYSAIIYLLFKKN